MQIYRKEKTRWLTWLEKASQMGEVNILTGTVKLHYNQVTTVRITTYLRLDNLQDESRMVGIIFYQSNSINV